MASLRSPSDLETLYLNYEHIPTAEELYGVKQNIYYRNYNQNEQNHDNASYTYQPIQSDPDIKIVDISDILENQSNQTKNSTGTNSNSSADVNVTTAPNKMDPAVDIDAHGDRSFDQSLDDRSLDNDDDDDDDDVLLIVDRVEDCGEDKSKQLKPLKLKKTYKCSFCSDSFPSINLRKEHESSGHTGVRMFECAYCDMYFTTKYRKKVHEVKHSSDYPYVCPFCGDRFKTIYKQQQHEKVHSEDLSFRCQYCNECFPTRYKKNLHEVRHISDKPYECQYCDQAFKSQYRCKQHELAHSSNKPYPCQFCKESFKSAHKRYLHLLSHSGLLNPYQCPKCPMGDKSTAFRTPYKLRAHLAAVHQLKPSDMRNLFQVSTHRDAFVLAKAKANNTTQAQNNRTAAQNTRKTRKPPSTMDLGYLRILPDDEVLTCFNCSATFGNKLGLISHIRASHTFTFL